LEGVRVGVVLDVVVAVVVVVVVVVVVAVAVAVAFAVAVAVAVAAVFPVEVVVVIAVPFVAADDVEGLFVSAAAVVVVAVPAASEYVVVRAVVGAPVAVNEEEFVVNHFDPVLAVAVFLDPVGAPVDRNSAVDYSPALTCDRDFVLRPNSYSYSYERDCFDFVRTVVDISDPAAVRQLVRVRAYLYQNLID